MTRRVAEVHGHRPAAGSKKIWTLAAAIPSSPVARSRAALRSRASSEARNALSWISISSDQPCSSSFSSVRVRYLSGRASKLPVAIACSSSPVSMWAMPDEILRRSSKLSRSQASSSMKARELR